MNSGRNLPVHGIVLFDKPLGWSSNMAVQKLKRLFGAAKAGHTGTLDPLATGMLPICLGEATKVAGLLLGERKAYRALLRLGATTTTADAEGAVIARAPVPALDAALLRATLDRFVGRITQVPPVYSAIKRDGVPLYERARRGEDVAPPPPREVTIERIDLLGFDADTVDIEVHCGSGTYIRSLAVDLGAALGCGAHLGALRRLWVEPFVDAPMVDFDALSASPEARAAALQPIESAIAGLPRIDLDFHRTGKVHHGNAVEAGEGDWTGACRLHDHAGRILALAERRADGRVQPTRVFVL